MEIRLDQMMRPIVVGIHDVTPYLVEMDTNRIYASGGPLARALEQRHARRLGVSPDCVVAVTSATAGLMGAITVSPADHWRVPAFTFAAVGHAVYAAGCTMDIQDVDPNTWRISNDGRDSGLIGVLPFGSGLTPHNWLPSGEVIVDAAASLGSCDISLADLPDSWTVVFSLHTTKVMSSTEGGLVVCGNATRADEVRAWAHFRLNAQRSAHAPGFNALMPEVSAAYGLAALDNWDEEQNQWRQARKLVDDATQRLGLGLPPGAGVDAHPYWNVCLPNVTATTEAECALKDAGIASRRWWGPGLHRMAAFESSSDSPCAVTDEIAATTLGLPFFRGITASEVDAVAFVLEDSLTRL